MFLVLAVAVSVSATPETHLDVSGTWTITVDGDVGSATQTIVLAQNGGKITGTFKGRTQSGTLEGTLDGNSIKFRVNTRVPIDYIGIVDHNSMKGTLSLRGKSGDWTATRGT